MSKVDQAIATLVQETLKQQIQITSVRPPRADAQTKFKDDLKRVQDLRGRNLFYGYLGSGLGHGPYVELEDGSVKLDLINGIGIHLFGHSHPMLIEAAVRAAIQDVIMQGNLQPNKEYGELLELLVTSAGRHSRIKKGWITTCGTMANENALKMVRQKNTPARKILAFRNAFAGRSTMMAEVTDNPDYRVGLPSYNEVLYLPFYDKKNPRSTEDAVALLRKHIDENPKTIACFIFELLQGEGGFNVAPPEFFKALFDICRQHHIALWADEVQTFGRTGQLFAFETLGLGEYIDIVTIAKTIQCGAVLYTDEYNPKPGLVAGTFTGATVSLATGAATIKMLLGESNGRPTLGPKGTIQSIHEKFVGMLKTLAEGSCKGLIQGVDGMGLMIAMTPYDGSKEKTSKLLQQLFQNGLLAFSCGHGPYKVRFLLPAILEDAHINEARSILEKTLLENA